MFLLIPSCRPPPRSVPGLVWVIRSLYCCTRNAFWVLGLGLGLFLPFFPFFFVLPTPPAQSQAVVWVIGPLKCDTGLSVFHVRLFVVLPTPFPTGPGAICPRGIFTNPTVAQDRLIFLFSFSVV